MVKSYEEIHNEIKSYMWYSLNYVVKQQWLSSITDPLKPIKLQVLIDLCNQMVFPPMQTPTVTLIQGQDILFRKKLYEEGFGYERYGTPTLYGIQNRLKRFKGTDRRSFNKITSEFFGTSKM